MHHNRSEMCKIPIETRTKQSLETAYPHSLHRTPPQHTLFMHMKELKLFKECRPTLLIIESEHVVLPVNNFTITLFMCVILFLVDSLCELFN